jgi:hypothetical protein
MSATGVERGGVRRKGELYTGDIDLLWILWDVRSSSSLLLLKSRNEELGCVAP